MDSSPFWTLVSTAMFAPPPQGGDLARRVAAAPDGIVKMTYRLARRDLWRRGGTFHSLSGPNPTRGFDVWFMEGMSMSADVNRRTSRRAMRTISGQAAARGARRSRRRRAAIRGSDERRVRARGELISGPCRWPTLPGICSTCVARTRGRGSAMRFSPRASPTAWRIAQPLAAMARNKSLAPSVARECSQVGRPCRGP
jgi:hypothetical protein